MKVSLLSVLAFFLATTLQSAYAKTLVISDVDDTIKMSGILNSTTHVVYNGLFTKKSFSGMSELYQELQDSQTSIYYVSGSPEIIRFRVREFLEDNDFPQIQQLVLRKSLKQDTILYKIETIRKLIAKLGPDKIIMIGDDTEHDPEIFNTIYQENVDKTESIYIRSVQNRVMPSNPVIKTFFSAVEIAGFELLRGRIHSESFSKVVNGFLKQTNESGIFLKKRYCPKQGREQLEELRQKTRDQKIIDLFEKTQEKIVKVCRPS